MTGDAARGSDPPGFLCVANFDSDVGYAWWLMESFWVMFADKLADRYTVYLAYPSISKLPAAVEQSSLAVEQADFVTKGLAAWMSQAAWLRRHRIEVVYLSDQPTVHFKYALFRLAGVRHIIVHDHSPGIRSRPRGLRRTLKDLLARSPLIAVDAAVGATDFVRRRLVTVNCLPRGRCFSANNGLPPETNVPGKRDPYRDFDIPKRRRLIVTAARANPVKRIDFAIEMTAALVQQRGIDDVHYLFFGDGPELANLEAKADALGIAEYVTFAGNVDRPEDYYHACHVAIHPSSAEVGYSLAILEYMRGELPTVVPDNRSVCGATTDEVDGLVYTEGDLDDAVAKIANLLRDDRIRRRMASSARLKVEQLYKLEATHRDLLRAATATIGGTPGTTRD